MAPAEIWQGGKMINKITTGLTHKGKLDGEPVVVKDSGLACNIHIGKEIKHLSYGDSMTLDGGEIVKSVLK